MISRCVSGSLDVLKMRFGVVLKCFGVFPRSKNCPTKFDFVQQKLAVYQIAVLQLIKDFAKTGSCL